MKPDSEKIIAEVLATFDFDKVHRVMMLLDWEWGPIERVPTIDELRACAEKLLKQAWDVECTVRTGGFSASYVSPKNNDGAGELNLMFILERSF